MRYPLALAASLCCAPLWSQASSPRDLTAFLPAGTPLVVDLSDGAKCLERALGLLQPLPDGLPPGFRLFVAGLPLLTKATTGLAMSDLMEVVTPGHAVFALVLPAQGKPYPVLMSRIDEPAEIERLRRRIGEKLIADFSSGVLTVSDSRAHLREVLAFRASGRPSLLSDANYRAGRPALRPGSEIRVFVDLARIRALTGKRLWAASASAARLFLGPSARTLDLASRVDARLMFDQGGLRLAGRADAVLGEDPVARLRTGSAHESPAMPDGTLAFLSLDRDLRAFLADSERWVGRDGAVQVQKFLSTADQFLGGSSLLGDVLPNVSMPIDLFVTSADAARDDEGPVIELPDISFVFGVRADSSVEELLDRGARVITTIVNAQRLQKKQTQVRMRRGRRGGYQYKSVLFGDWNGPGRPPVEHGLSPTLLFAHGHGILSSTVDGAVRIAEALAKKEPRPIQGDVLAIRGAELAELVRRNRSILITDRILKEGETRKEAGDFLSVLESVLRILELDASVVPGSGVTRFDLSLRRHR